MSEPTKAELREAMDNLATSLIKARWATKADVRDDRLEIVFTDHGREFLFNLEVLISVPGVPSTPAQKNVLEYVFRYARGA